MGKSLLYCLLLGATILTADSVPAATIPAGTPIVVKTSVALSSREASGRRFAVEVVRNVMANGKVAVPAGTKGTAIVKSPLVRVGSTTRPLTFRLVQLNGHAVKSADLEVDNMSPWTVGARRVQVSGAAYAIPAGSVFQFQLKDPAQM